MEFTFNKYQTELTAELLEQLPADIVESLIEYIDSVPMIASLVSEHRETITARELNEKTGKRVIDITNPHILEDMDYFRERAIFFETHGRYTNITPNPNPKSEYALFWKEELKRCKHGLVRESDGEWIPGYLYFYWNYSPIWLVEKDVEDLTLEEWLYKILNPKAKDAKTKQKGERKRKFPKPWLGDYLYYHYIDQAREKGKHGKLLKTRGVGFSFKMGSISPCNMYTLPGSGNPNFHLASEKTFLEGDKGIWGKVVDNLDWIAENTPWPRLRLANKLSDMEIQLGFQDEYGSRKGLLSSVFGISLKDNPDKARGIRGPLIHYEEDGLFPNLEKAWGVNRKAVEDGDVSFGFMLAGGTGGTEGASFEGSEKLFYNPDAYNIYSVPNVYDKNANGECGFFWGAYINRNGCYCEETGEPDVIKALLEILVDRKLVRENSTDPKAITQRMAEEPIVPQEAVMRTTGTLFPVYELKQRYAEVKVNSSLINASWKGKMVVNGQAIKHVTGHNVNIISKFPHTEQMPGGIEIFEHPITDSDGQIPRFRYIAGCDPVDDDGSGTNSLLSTFIMNTLTGDIVAEYTGRPQITEEYFEQQRLLLKYYNATMNYENNKKGLYTYYRNMNSLGFLCETPEILRDTMNVTINKIGNKRFGTPASKAVNVYALNLVKKWLLSPALHQPEDAEEPVLNLHRIRSLPLLEELIAWHPDGNFDRVSSLGMLMIYREDIYKILDYRKEDKELGVSGNPFWFQQFGTKNNSYMVDKIKRMKF